MSFLGIFRKGHREEVDPLPPRDDSANRLWTKILEEKDRFASLPLSGTMKVCSICGGMEFKRVFKVGYMVEESFYNKKWMDFRYLVVSCSTCGAEFMERPLDLTDTATPPPAEPASRKCKWCGSPSGGPRCPRCGGPGD